VSDFGLAREAERLTTALTSTLGGLGTFLYAAPELYRGAKRADAAADIFSLGEVLHELVTGEAPMEVPSSGRFRIVIQKATKARPDQRYATATELLDAIERAAKVPTEWRGADEVAESLAARLRLELPDEAAISELVDLLGGTDPKEAVRELRTAIPEMSRGVIEQLWQEDPEAFRALAERFGEHVEESGWDFSFCDTIANFFDRAVIITADDDVLHSAVRALIELGASHNRWHVRDVVIGMLQRVRESHAALAATEAIRESRPAALEWTLSDFAIRSLHPTIRDATIDLIAGPKK
jgi:hypothetical protein